LHYARTIPFIVLPALDILRTYLILTIRREMEKNKIRKRKSKII